MAVEAKIDAPGTIRTCDLRIRRIYSGYSRHLPEVLKSYISLRFGDREWDYRVWIIQLKSLLFLARLHTNYTFLNLRVYQVINVRSFGYLSVIKSKLCCSCAVLTARPPF